MSDKMKESIRAATLSELVDEFNGDLGAVTEEYENHGICGSCGHVQSGVEPDAEDYECEECHNQTVNGMLSIMVGGF